MQLTSYSHNLTFSDQKVRAELILETPFSKEIRILLGKGQSMKEHTAPFAIVVHLLQGKIDFGVNGEKHSLKQGAILTLDAKVPHDLYAHEDSVVRLTLSKNDQAQRVADVAKN